jgi:hypothetical protein
LTGFLFGHSGNVGNVDTLRLCWLASQHIIDAPANEVFSTGSGHVPGNGRRRFRRAYLSAGL